MSNTKTLKERVTHLREELAIANERLRAMKKYGGSICSWPTYTLVREFIREMVERSKKKIAEKLKHWR